MWCLGGDVRVCAEELLTVPKERAPAEREFPRRVVRVEFWSRSAGLVRGLVREWWLLPAGIIGQVGLLQVAESPGSVRETVTVGVIALQSVTVGVIVLQSVRETVTVGVIALQSVRETVMVGVIALQSVRETVTVGVIALREYMAYMAYMALLALAYMAYMVAVMHPGYLHCCC